MKNKVLQILVTDEQKKEIEQHIIKRSFEDKTKYSISNYVLDLIIEDINKSKVHNK